VWSAYVLTGAVADIVMVFSGVLVFVCEKIKFWGDGFSLVKILGLMMCSESMVI
jgi:hypothetical protein